MRDFIEALEQQKKKMFERGGTQADIIIQARVRTTIRLPLVEQRIRRLHVVRKAA
jgi:hypothetical protein